MVVNKFIRSGSFLGVYLVYQQCLIIFYLILYLYFNLYQVIKQVSICFQGLLFLLVILVLFNKVVIDVWFFCCKQLWFILLIKLLLGNVCIDIFIIIVMEVFQINEILIFKIKVFYFWYCFLLCMLILYCDFFLWIFELMI